MKESILFNGTNLCKLARVLKILRNRLLATGYILTLILILLMISCGLKTHTLKDGYTRVPIDKGVYKNKAYFNPSLFRLIDTSVLYEEFDVDKGLPVREVPCKYCRSYSLLKFYPNGSMNEFGFDRDELITINKIDPLYVGLRGVFYKKNNNIRYDLFAAINNNYDYGKISATLNFDGDKLYIKEEYSKYTTVYIKRKFPPSFFKFTPNW